MQESTQPSERSGKHRLLNTTPNARVLVTLVVGLAVVLAGCTGIGGFGGGGGGGVAEADTVNGGDEDSTAAPTDGDDDGSGDATATENAGGNVDTTDETDETTTADSTDAAEPSGGGASGDDSATGGATGGETDIAPLDAPWHNFTANAYVFEVEDAENGTGTVAFEPNESAEATGLFGSVYPIVTYEGDDSLEAAYTARSDQTGDPTTPVLYALSVGGLLGFVDQENLTVGYERTAAANGTEVTTRITGQTSYGGVGCYATEVHADGQLILETCNVPYTDDVFGIVNYPPYAAIYDENGEVVREVALVEMRDADTEA